MSLFIRLFTVAAMAVLLRCVPAAVVITAPSTVTDNTGGLETREQGPTAWICSALAVDSPWTSYSNIRGYLEGGNAERKDYSNLVLYPVMELFHKSESRLCVYLPAEDHCYPPAPTTNQVKTVKQLTNRNYYAIRFWGQASDARVQYYKQKLTAALNARSKAANFDLFFVSYFNDHVREVRFDAGTTAVGKSAEPPAESGSLACPAGPDSSLIVIPVQVAGVDYLRVLLEESRLSLADVRTEEINSTNMQSIAPCATAASSRGRNAFSFVDNSCKLYNFYEEFCPCEGDFEIYINKKLLGVTKYLGAARVVDKDMKEMIIYSKLPMTSGPYADMIKWKSKEGDFAGCQNVLRNSPGTYSAAITLGKYCYLTKAIDAANCNQTCRGKAAQAIVMKDNPNIGPPFLSLCQQKVSIPMFAGTNGSKVHFFSHAGHGCYPYPEAKVKKDVVCVVTFEKAAAAKTIQFEIEFIDLIGKGVNCTDYIAVYDGHGTTDDIYLSSHCNGNKQVATPEAITIAFVRMRNNVVGMNMGFKVSFRSLA